MILDIEYSRDSSDTFMTLNTHQKLCLSAISLTLFISSCASSPDLSSDESDSGDQYWYCAPGDKRSWRCAEDKQALGLSYYRFWKTIPDPAEEGIEEEATEEDIAVQKEDGPASAERVSEDKVLVKGATISELEPDAATEADSEVEVDETQILYSKVLQVAAYKTPTQAQAFADSLGKELTQKPSVIQTRVNDQLYYTVVYQQLKSRSESEQLINQLKKYFPLIEPWLRSRTGFNASRVD